MIKATIQFLKGIDEKVLPTVYLTRSRDGSTGTATFQFQNPNLLERTSINEGEITGMYLIDEEGIIETRIITANFKNGKPNVVESIYIMKSAADWNRFMRFMKRYSELNDLDFIKS